VDTTLPRVVVAAASTHGDRPAYVDGRTVVTFTDLLARVRETARGYCALGLQPGDPVCVWAPNRIEWVVSALAATYAGGVLVPVNSRYTASEAADIVERTRATVVVVDDGFLGRTQIADLRAAGSLAGVREVVDLNRLDRLADLPTDVDVDARARAVAPDDVADILFTSGTTGRSKGAMSTHRQTVGVADIWGRLGGVSAADRYLVVNPFFHSFGYKVGIVTGLLTGATLYPMATFDVDAVARLVESARITVLPGAPTIFSSLLAADAHHHRDLSSLRLAVTGAAVVPVVLIERMRSELAIDKVVTAFGMTEAVMATMCRGDEPADVVASTCGRAVPGMEVRIGDQDEVLLRGDYVMQGYLDDPQATSEAIDADGWLHTGDVGALDEAGNLRITDRLKDMYISGGFNVYPAEVEQVLSRMEGVVDVAVAGVPDERLGEVGKAWVVTDGPGPTTDDVIAFARQHLANFKVPRQVELVDALPRNPSGKVLKTELRGRTP
jgi:acyl-CoA synthetase (AMP-forming)/AMP-acid ligase II